MSVVASLPQNTHLPFVPDWCSGIQREETPAFSFMPSSHSRLPHHFVRAKPPRPEAISLTSSQVGQVEGVLLQIRSRSFEHIVVDAVKQFLDRALERVERDKGLFPRCRGGRYSTGRFSRSRGPISIAQRHTAHFVLGALPAHGLVGVVQLRAHVDGEQAGLELLGRLGDLGLLVRRDGNDHRLHGRDARGRTSPLLSPWVMMTAPIMRVVEPQEVWNGYWSLLSRPAKVTS